MAAAKKSSSEFVRIVFSPLSQGVKLPTVFMERHGQFLDDGTKVTLKVPSGASWAVHLQQRTDIGLWLGPGWEEFAQYYGIEVRHFLLFQYLGRAEFKVIIMDTTGSEIEYPMEEGIGRRDKEELDSFRRAKRFESENPFTLSVMRPSYVRNRYMLSLNPWFVRDLLPRAKPYIVQASVGGRSKVWSMHWYVGRAANVTKGWKELGVGDVCVFELVNPADLRFHITIFRNT